MSTDTCAACGAAPAPSARWCGHCGASLRPRRTRRTAAAGPAPDRATGDPALVGAGRSVLLLEDDADDDEVTASGRTWSPRARAAAALGVLLVLAAALVLRPEPEVVYEPRGYTARGDATRSGVVSLAPLLEPTAVAWSADVGAARTSQTVRSAGDVVLERTSGGVLVIREATDGSVRWLRRDLAPGRGAVRAGDTVVAAERGELRGFAVADGTERWSSHLRSTADELHPLGGDVLAWSRSTNTLRAVDATSGSTRWELIGERRFGGTVQRVVPGGAGIGLWLTTPPGLAPDSPRAQHFGILLDAATGEPLLQRPLAPLGPDFVTGDPVAVGERGVALVTQATEFDALGGWGVELVDPTGATLRRLPAAGFPDRMAITGETLVVATRGEGLVALDLRTGTRRWVRPDVDARSQLVASDGLVVAGTGSIIDVQTGRTIGSARRLDVDAIAGERTVQVLPAVAGTELELRDRAGDRLATAPLVTDEAAAPAVGAGRVVVPTRDGLRTFHVGDGELDWGYDQLATGLGPDGTAATARTPAVAGTTVLVTPGSPFGSGPGLVALELTGGVRTWDRDDDVPTVRGPLTLAGEVAFVPVGAEVHAYDVVTGRRAFAAVAGATLGPLVLSPNRVIGGPAHVPGADDGPGTVPGDHAVAILRRDRSESWRTPLRPCTGPALAGERVVWGTATGLVALEELSGEPAWEVPTGRPVCLNPVVAGGRVVVVEDPGTLRAVAAADGTPTWSTELPAPPVAAPVVAGGHLLVPLLDGTLAAYDLDDGAPAWRFDLGGIADASPAVLDDRILVHLRDGRLLALRP